MNVDQQTTEELPGRWDDRGQEAGAFSLLVVSDGVTSTYPLGAAGRFLIGRAKQAQIRIDHGSVSREHAALYIGEGIELEDLGSANGTRVRDTRLTPGVAVRVAPNEVIDLGESLLVVQYRRLEQGLRRICSPEFFSVRLEEESVSGRPNSARLDAAGELGKDAILLLLASQLAARELVCCPRRDQYELLFLDTDAHSAEARRVRLSELLTARGVSVRSALRVGSPDMASATGALPGPAPSDASVAVGEVQFVAKDPAMLRVRRLLERVADSELSVILLGETGVGKEVCAELLHAASPRAKTVAVELRSAQ